MQKKDLIRDAAQVLRDNNVRKLISFPKRTFTISDGVGTEKKFVFGKTEKGVLYNAEDVEAVLDACRIAIQNAIKRGEDVGVYGFGKLVYRYKEPRSWYSPMHDQTVTSPGGYYLRFICGNDLRRSVQMYEQAIADGEINKPKMLPQDDEEEYEDFGEDEV